MNKRLPFVLAALFVLAFAAPLRAQPFEPAFPFSAVDLEHTRSFEDGESQKMGEQYVRMILAFPYRRHHRMRPFWEAGRPGGEKKTYHYRIALERPVPVGAVSCTFGDVYVLKPDAPYPGDPTQPDHWRKLPRVPTSGALRLSVPDPGLTTRAFLCRDVRDRGASRLSHWVFFRDRIHSITRLGVANAQREYTVYPHAAPPHTYAAQDVIRGGEWRNAGTDKEGNVTTPPVSELHPTWFTLSWQQEQTFRRFVLDSTMTKAKIYTYVGPPGLNPAAGAEKDWRWQHDAEMVRRSGRVWFTLPERVTTRGIKLLIEGSQEEQIVSIHGFDVLVPLGERPVPDLAGRQPERAPFSVDYEIPQDGYLTVAVDSAEGARARNLMANVDLAGGPYSAHWDLKDRSGHYVQPGNYTFKAIYHPPLKLEYQMTAYPNVTTHFPDRAAWLTSTSGPHGWMADHTPPRAVAVAPESVWFGAPVAESGVSLVQCDLDGKKQWARHSFARFTGAHWLAADDEEVFIAAPARNAAGDWNVDPNTEAIWAIGHESHSQRTVARLEPTGKRKRGIKGMGARDGRIYLAVNASYEWLKNAAGAADVDITKCVPPYKPKREPKRAHEIVSDPRNDFLRLFRLTGKPPGYSDRIGLIYLESTRGPSSRQHIVLSFKKPVKLGSAVFPVPLDRDYKIKLSVLKPDAPYPPKPDKPKHWREIEHDYDLAWDCVPFPDGTETRALRITFYKGEDDVFSRALLGGDDGGEGGLPGMPGADDAGGDQGSGEAWKGRLEGMKLLRRRYRNLMDSARIRVNSGRTDERGRWWSLRDEPVSYGNPAVYALQWDEAQKIRGLAIKEIDGKLTKIDVYTGPPDSEIDIEGEEHWENLATYRQKRRMIHSNMEGHNAMARYVDGYVDFGREVSTRAVRLRIVEHWTSDTRKGAGVRIDRGGKTLDLTRARVYGVAPLRYLGGSDRVDPRIAERVEVIDARSGKVTEDVYLSSPGDLALGPDGTIFAISHGKLVRVDVPGGEHEVVIDDLIRPRALTVSPNGEIFVYDHAPDRRVIRVYSTEGEHLRTIGKPGGYRAGPWDPYRLNSVSDLGIDSAGHLWAVDWTYYPKRVAQFTTAGEHVKDLFGPTRYGGNGVLDPWKKQRLFLGPCEFGLDWESGTVRLENLTGHPHPADLPVRIEDRTYLVTRPRFFTQGAGVVRLHEGNRSRMVAAVGVASGFSPLATQEVLSGLGHPVLERKRFIWTDRSGDGAVQAEEVQLSPRGGMKGVSDFDRSLGVQAGNVRYEPKEFLPDGTPVYEEKHLGFPNFTGHAVLKLDDGSYFHIADGGYLENAAFTPEGEKLWGYPTEGSGVHGLFSAKPYFDGQVVAQFGFVGHETAHAGDLGEFVVIHSNVGEWSIWTADGLYAGHILRNYRRGGARWWRFPEHDRGMDLTGLTAGKEHFRGYFCRSFQDDRYYIVAGHNHASLVEVKGLENFQRFTKTVEVTAADLQQVQQWERQREKKRVYARAPVIDCYRIDRKIEVDGSDGEWKGGHDAEFTTETGGTLRFRMGYDDLNLYVFYDVENLGPFKNTGDQWQRLFKTGAAVDLKLATNPGADPTRRAPGPGDVRLLMTRTEEAGDTAVLYRPVVPGAPEEKGWVAISPVGKAHFDVVERLETVRLAHRRTERGYAVEAEIPLEAIGLTPKDGLRLKMDWGVLRTDPHGHIVTRRRYWANKATEVISDTPTESRLHPDLWGVVRFHGKKATLLEETAGAGPGGAEEEKEEEGVDDFLQELEADMK